MAARRPLIVGNWKMHGTRAGAEQLLLALKAQIAGADLADREVAVAPPFTALETAARVLATGLRQGSALPGWQAGHQ